MASKQAQRKPYHIVKQREKWKVEEHNKFVEALEIYGRGWPQITEYVGTKTIAQIRSHAQKFFKKLALPLPTIKSKPKQPRTPQNHHRTVEEEDQELKKPGSSSRSSASSCIKIFEITMATSSGSSSSGSSTRGGNGRDMTLLNLLV